MSYKSKKWHNIYFLHYFTEIIVDLYDSLDIEKTLTFHDIIILIKLVLYKDKNTTALRYF